MLVCGGGSYIFVYHVYHVNHVNHVHQIFFLPFEKVKKWWSRNAQRATVFFFCEILLLSPNG